MTCNPQQQIAELRSLIGDMENDVLSILDFAALIEECQPGPVITDDVSGGIHRVVAQIREHARALREARTNSWQIVCKLANP